MTYHVLLKDANHGDLKTAAVFPDRWPTLKAGTVVKFIKNWSNFYGRQATVETVTGNQYDIDPLLLGKIVEGFDS